MRPSSLLQIISSPSSDSSYSSAAFPHHYSLPSNSIASNSWHDPNQDLPGSWNQLLNEEERCSSFTPFYPKVENWENPIISNQHESSEGNIGYYVHANGQQINEENQHEVAALAVADGRSPWNQLMVLPAVLTSSSPSPRSSNCITSLSSNILDFSNIETKVQKRRSSHPRPDHSPECNSTATGSTLIKKARMNQASSPQTTTFKVRKEKLGDRITMLHQLVSPFGKTDTASVLLEAIGYIRFLHGQVQVLSSPYLGSAEAAGSTRHNSGDVDVFDEEAKSKDLKSRGLCLVPMCCTMHVGSQNEADYWVPAPAGDVLDGGFRR